ncbi:MAG: hypothetical protein ACNS62_05960 [Candidatus Cyclobacteriaceae bacterium M3_2C_046]
MKITYILICCLCSLGMIQAQPTQEHDYYQLPDQNVAKPMQKIRFGLNAGTSFGFMPGWGNHFNTYLSPYLSRSVNKDLTINAGISFGTTLMNNPWLFPSDNNQPLHQARMNSTSVFINGQQMIGERLLISGTAFYEKSHFMNNALGNFDSKGVSMDFNYKVNKNFSFGAGFRFSNQNRPFNQFNQFNNPYLQPGLYQFNPR